MLTSCKLLKKKALINTVVQKTVAVKQCFYRKGLIRNISSRLRDLFSSEGGLSRKSGFGRSIVFCGLDNDGVEISASQEVIP